MVVSSVLAGKDSKILAGENSFSDGSVVKTWSGGRKMESLVSLFLLLLDLLPCGGCLPDMEWQRFFVVQVAVVYFYSLAFPQKMSFPWRNLIFDTVETPGAVIVPFTLVHISSCSSSPSFDESFFRNF